MQKGNAMKVHNRSRQFHVETLEQRELLSWVPGTIPIQIAPPSAVGQHVMTSNSLAFSGTVANTQGNPQVFQQYTFIPSRTASYTISVNDTGNHSLAPIWALWNSSGREINYDYQGGVCNIAATVNLIQGQRYELGINNVNGYSGGSFTGTITGAPVSQSWDYPDGNCFTSGVAIVSGNTLTISMYASNTSWNTTYSHTMRVYLENAYNQVIWSWSYTIQTYGTAPWEPSRHSFSNAWPYDLSGVNLTGLTHIYICG
jgi:hypothetical protein